MTPDLDKAVERLELLPCPFCGGDARRWAQPSGGVVIGCAAGLHYCSVQPEVHAYEPEALAAWNRRPLPDPDRLERIARIIDPDIWSTRDYLYSLPDPITYAADSAVELSLAKAAEIAAQPVGAVAIREALEKIASTPRMTGPSPIGPLFGAGFHAGQDWAAEIARAALAPPQHGAEDQEPK